jgi:hypothetical protein
MTAFEPKRKELAGDFLAGNGNKWQQLQTAGAKSRRACALKQQRTISEQRDSI